MGLAEFPVFSKAGTAVSKKDVDLSGLLTDSDSGMISMMDLPIEKIQLIVVCSYCLS